MTQPKNLTPEALAEFRAKNNERNKRYRQKNLDKLRERGRAHMRKWRAAHPDRARRTSLKSNRKSLGVNNPTGETKSGPCEICGMYYENLHFDHNHATGEHRGWLCSWCNRQLGWYEKLKDKIEAYLLRSE